VLANTDRAIVLNPPQFSMREKKPILIIITGRPAAGKSTLAKWLSQELGVPYVSKDNIREVLFDRLGWKDRAWAQLLGRASIDIMFYFAETQLEAGQSLILDNAFDPALSAPRFSTLKTKFGIETIQLSCDSDEDTLLGRFQTRANAGARHPGHGDEDALVQLRTYLASGQSPIMDIGGAIVQIDTTDFAKIDYSRILHEVKLAMQHRQSLGDFSENSFL
jgi:predicted kinase